jgi:hypothetical protein
MVEIGEAVMVAEATAAEGSGEEVSGSETEDPAVGDAGAASGATSPLSTKKKR